ncbi:sirohydrochlorin chelatase [Diaphorobacter aerolatus]|uniref:CbiX/SirB N-terminal domain-containing protein n=1 Tax=Diaphorobacter aerolatus TaxID=1288495 RepID=A0A7H0GKK8_9BURK|nr:CbiX/SirB N-terminal domain-containing protein [Diaphorobacter aerolatus]QNP48824.1 CbiX/SirB N-terminal domain-containing protein [Diaphorobacter aerolatus]
MPDSGVILFAHGSRDPQWRLPIEAVARLIETQRGDVAVACAYLELNEPDLSTVVQDWAARGIHKISVMPMFLGAGRHAREDLPRMVHDLQLRYPVLELRLQTPIGEDARVTALMALIAADSAIG